MKTIFCPMTWILLLASVWTLSGCAATRPAEDMTKSPLETPHYLTVNGERCLKAGNVQGAIPLFQKALAMNEDYVPAMVGMAEAETSLGNEKEAFQWGEKGLDRAGNGEEKSLARAALMETYLKFKPDDWCRKMESLWRESRDENPKAEDATLLMGRGYQADGRYLKAQVCYRQVIDWNGDGVKEADQLMEKLYRQLRAEPGTHAGPMLAAMDQVSRGDFSVLLIEELKLPEYLDARRSRKYAARFQPPGATASNPQEEAVPADVLEHPFAVDIKEVLKYHIRGLEPFPDGLFHPEQPLSRANFALAMEDVLVRAKEEPKLKSAFVGNASPFPDVSNGHYAFNAMILCTTRDLLAADLDGAFRPAAPVTGAEALLALRKLREDIKGRQIKY